MRKLLVALALIAATSLSAAPPVIVKKLYVVDDVGTLRAGVLVLPGDYATTTDSLALVKFDHGVGEAGDGTLGTVERIYGNGSPVGLAAGGTTMTFTDPVTGKAWRFAAFGLQGTAGWCAYPEQGAYALRNDVLKNYRISRLRVYQTGLSAGGEVTWEGVTRDATFALYAAAVPMSTPAPGTGPLANLKVNPTKIWAFHGLTDGGYTPPDITVKLVSQVDDVQHGLARATYFSGNHCCWGTYFDPGYREDVTYFVRGVKYIKSMDVYEFMLACARGSGFLFDTAANTNKPPGTATLAVPVVTVSGTTATLDATASTGNGGIGSWYWNYTAPAGASKPYFADGRSDGGTQLGTKTLMGLSTGTWTFTLTVQDKYGGFNTASVTATVGGGTTPTPTKKVASVSTSVVNGLIVVTISWSDGTTTTYQ